MSTDEQDLILVRVVKENLSLEREIAFRKIQLGEFKVALKEAVKAIEFELSSDGDKLNAAILGERPTADRLKKMPNAEKITEASEALSTAVTAHKKTQETLRNLGL